MKRRGFLASVAAGIAGLVGFKKPVEKVVEYPVAENLGTTMMTKCSDPDDWEITWVAHDLSKDREVLPNGPDIESLPSLLSKMAKKLGRQRNA